MFHHWHHNETLELQSLFLVLGQEVSGAGHRGADLRGAGRHCG